MQKKLYLKYQLTFDEYWSIVESEGFMGEIRERISPYLSPPQNNL